MERQSYGFGGRGRGRPRGTGRIFFLVRCFSRVLNVCLVAGDRGGRGGGYSSYYRGGSNGSYRGGDRDRNERDSRHGSFGSSVGSGGGSYQSRVNGPHQHQYHGNSNSSTTSPAPDFDLQAESSFPPLPGLEAGASAGATHTASNFSAGMLSFCFINVLQLHNSGVDWLGGAQANSDAPSKAEEHSTLECVASAGGNSNSGGSSTSGAWGESKLSDVVKGVAKPKSGSNNGHGPKHPLLNGPALVPSGGNNSASSSAATATPSSSAPPGASAATATIAPKGTSVESQTSPLPNGDLAQSTLALTPPTSPGKKEKPFAASTITNTSKPAKAHSSSQTLIHQQQIPATTAHSDVTPSKAAVAPVPPPGVSYAKMAEQNKDRLEQMAREVKERELEQERERRRVAQTSKLSICRWLFVWIHFNLLKIYIRNGS